MGICILYIDGLAQDCGNSIAQWSYHSLVLSHQYRYYSPVSFNNLQEHTDHYETVFGLFFVSSKSDKGSNPRGSIFVNALLYEILGRELSPNQRSRWKHAFSLLKHV